MTDQDMWIFMLFAIVIWVLVFLFVLIATHELGWWRGDWEDDE